MKRGLLLLTPLLGAIATVLLHQQPNDLGATLRQETSSTVLPRPSAMNFLVVAGGGAPSYNEIALEKNVRYFQRTLAHLGWDPAAAATFFANGRDGQATVRYLNLLGQERFKVPEISHLAGAATADNLRQWLAQYPQDERTRTSCPVFFYFTGHGALNRQDPNNNALILWEEDLISVQDLAQELDQWPADIPFVTMMAQCYSGSFANLIYKQGDPAQGIAPQPRCGFFATVKTRPSVGCTPLVNEADYKDYSSSFFAGMSGQDRLGNPMASADFNQDGQVSFAEAHAFAKVDEETSDWPLSTSEAWLQEQASEAEQAEILNLPIAQLVTQGRPEQRYVITALTKILGETLADSFADIPEPQSHWFSLPQEVLSAYWTRLRMELIAVGIEAQLREQGSAADLAVLQKLLDCEAGSWHTADTVSGS